MVNKKGYLKTIEAVIAIVLILVFIVSIWPKNQQAESGTPRNIELTLDRILNELQYNEDYRECIVEMEIPQDGLTLSDIEGSADDQLKTCYNKIIEFIDGIIPQAMEYKISICSKDGGCVPSGIEFDMPKENIYTKSAFITATLKIFNPKTIKIYVWRKA